ncbi:cbb3-type cytochrome c oxidase N-terminal domain-containing protein [Zobellia galactanivorans]|uniref:cbb3-type cytochrome c oxidase N-terminal domain-containing protein n=1 Tax=Zobellia galactanivorans (strain DSM 12802 / CCUG 47099 / CIP 106680 / NCIMB 13871 / Dsij) TaxID=63186 RepID=UPI001C07A9AB|nr:cbb3-type cytochrome c oxidase N-terminal domain-containing protein [Zobellia galactanivorans]MBU3026195.1 c-type cytochrome [Zobellia galactanivorans]
MKNTSTWWIKIPLIFFLIFGLTEFFVDSGEIPAFIKYPMAQVFLVFILFLLIVIAVITRAIENVMFQTLSKEGQERYIAAKSKSFQWEWGQKVYQKLLGSKPIEKEEEIILDHNYDGIRELDNNLPPWWVYLFYASIVFAVVYLARFHVFNDYNQDQEYEQEVAAAQLEIEAYKKTAKGLVDANTVELLTDAGDLKAGQTIFESNCIACHMADGGGGIGPNLTDQHWILGGGIKNVFHTISEGGRDGKGMIAWKQTLKPAEIAQVASYVLSFQGTTPANPKPAEGDLWVDPNATEQPAPAQENSTEQVIDSTSVTVN